MSHDGTIESSLNESKKKMMTRKKKSETVWVVVLVESGIPVLAEIHRDETTAKRRERFLRKDVREAYDEVGVFEVKLGSEAAA